MMARLIIFMLCWFAFPAVAQQLPDAVKLAPIYQQQRNAEADGRAQCIAIASDMQARIAELEKQLEEAKAASK